MNQDRIAGISKQIRGNMKVRLGRLRGRPLLAAEGVRDEVAGRIQEEYGRSREHAARALKRFLDRHRHWMRSGL